MEKSTEMKKSTFAIIMVSISIIIVSTISIAEILVEKEERRECIQLQQEVEKWKREKKEYFVKNWQVEQCDKRLINIDAPIKYERRVK